MGKECKQNRKLEVRSLISFGSRTLGGYCLGASPSALWIPIDLYLEDCIDGSVAATNSIELLSGIDFHT